MSMILKEIFNTVYGSFYRPLQMLMQLKDSYYQRRKSGRRQNTNNLTAFHILNMLIPNQVIANVKNP